MANKIKHLHEIKGRFAVRVNVPAPLRGIVFAGEPGSELREWLGTDRRAAERAAPEVIARFYRRIDEAKAQLTAAKPTLGTAAKHHYVAELAIDDRERMTGGEMMRTVRSFSAPITASKLRSYLAGDISDDEAEAIIGYAANDALNAGAASSDLDRRELLRAVAEAHLEVMARQQERDSGKIALSQPTSPLLQPEHPLEVMPASARRGKSNGKSLSDILKEFHAERTAGNGTLAETTIKEHVVAVRMLEEFLKGSVPADTITKEDMLAYKRALMRTPTNYTKRFPGKTLPEAIELNEALAKPHSALNPRTINNKWLSHIGTIMGWGERNGLLSSNPARGIKVEEGKGYKEPTRVPFSQDDLKAMFGTDLFLDPKRYESHQWALLIALYTGARSSSEVARIKLADIYKEQGVWVFDLVEATKNLHSKRIAPVHKALIELGLLEYIEKLRGRGETHLFPDWQSKRRDKINRWFLRTYRKKIGINDSRKVFHSFRHSLRTALARYGVNRDVADLIAGHKDQSVGGIYISDAALTMVKSMKEGIDRVEFDLGLPISGLSQTEADWRMKSDMTIV